MTDLLQIFSCCAIHFLLLCVPFHIALVLHLEFTVHQNYCPCPPFLRFITPSLLNLQFHHCLGFDSPTPCKVVSVFVSANRRNVLSAKRMGLTVIGIQGASVFIAVLLPSKSHICSDPPLHIIHNNSM